MLASSDHKIQRIAGVESRDYTRVDGKLEKIPTQYASSSGSSEGGGIRWALHTTTASDIDVAWHGICRAVWKGERRGEGRGGEGRVWRNTRRLIEPRRGVARECGRAAQAIIISAGQTASRGRRRGREGGYTLQVRDMRYDMIGHVMLCHGGIRGRSVGRGRQAQLATVRGRKRRGGESMDLPTDLLYHRIIG
jgi:hypothetical protein